MLTRSSQIVAKVGGRSYFFHWDACKLALIIFVTVTGPVARFARQIAGQGYIVAAPSSYHEFTGPEPLAYDVPGTDAGNEYKIKKVMSLISSVLPRLLRPFSNQNCLQASYTQR